jgi:hypothetical protein
MIRRLSVPNEHDWEQKLAFSSGVTESTHPDTIMKLLGDSCVRVEKNNASGNDGGVDFRAYLRRGSQLNIDVKAREKGCSRYWKACPLFGIALEPEFALETWSVIENREWGIQPVVGWTLDESKDTDYTLHLFDPNDTPEVFLLPFQLLRMSFRKNLFPWIRQFQVSRQFTPPKNGRMGWESECVFVPAAIVLDAIRQEMRN